MKMLKEYISRIPLFSGVNKDDLIPMLKDCDVRVLKPGEFIYKYGEYGDDCGIVLAGLMNVDIVHRSAADQVNKEIFLKEGDIFGEIAALSGYVRTADVSALKPTKVLILSKGKLCELFDKYPLIKNEVDKLYRKRALGSQLRSIPLFMGLPEILIEDLTQQATLISYPRGETVFDQGDEADAFYIVRHGFVKVTESGNNGVQRILAYLKGGHYFGEMALINEGQLRMATVTAIENTELVRISREDFQHLIEAHPRVKTGLKKSMLQLEESNTRIREDDYLGKTLSTVIDSGFVQSKEILVIDITKCIHCDTCIRACSALHDNQTRLIKEGIRLNNILLIPTSCRHCDNPKCMIKCPTGAINRGFGGEISYNASCIGCGRCAKNCMYGNITIVTLPEDNEEKDNKRFFQRYLTKKHSLRDKNQIKEKQQKQKRKAVKCDMCRDYPFMACVYNCPSGAARRIDPAEFMNDVIGAT